MLKNVSSNWILTLVQIAVTFVLMPFTIRTLGQDQYGTWILIASLTSYLSLMALGIPMATVRFVAKFAAGGNQEELDRTVGSCLGLYLLIGVAAMLIGIGLFFVFRSTYNVPAALRSRADLAFAITVVFIAAGFLGQLPYGIMSAHQDFVIKNRIQISGFLLRLVLTYVLLKINATMVWLAVIQVTQLTMEFSIASWVVARRYPRIHIRLSDFDPGMLKQIFSFSLFVLILQIGGQLAFQTDSLVIGAFRPVGDIPFFTVASSLAVYVMEFVIAIAAVVMPLATQLEAKGQWEELRVVFLKWSKITLSLTLMVGLFLIFIGPRFIAWWVEPSFESPAGRVLRILMTANLIFLPMRGVALPILMGLGRPAWPTVGFLIASVGNLALSIALAGPMGLDGVAWGTAIPNVLYALYVLVLACRAVGLPFVTYARYVGVRAALGTVPAVAVLWVLRYVLNVHGLFQIFFAGIGFVAVFAAIWVFFVYRRDRYVSLDPLFSRVPLLRAFA